MSLFGKRKKVVGTQPGPGSADPEAENLRQQIEAESKQGNQLRQALSPLSEPGAVEEMVSKLRQERLRGQLLRLQLENVRLKANLEKELESQRKDNEALAQKLQPPAPTP